MFTYACVLRSGGDYTPEYARRLIAGLRKHGTPDRRILLLTDMPVETFSDLAPTVVACPLLYDWPGWWAKMELFRPDLDALVGDLLYFDLDTILQGSLRDIESVCVGSPILLRCFLQPHVPGRVGSGMMFLPQSYRAKVWMTFVDSAQAWMRHYVTTEDWGDQGFLRDFLPGIRRWQQLVPDQIVSYKVNCLPMGGAPHDARVICFHGLPRPHQVNWTVSPVRRKTAPQPVVPPEVELAQKGIPTLRFSRVVERFDRAIIVGSGPSLADYNLAALNHQRATIIAVNGAIEHCPAELWMTVDPSPENRHLMLNQRSGCHYYAAVPDNFGSPSADTATMRLTPPVDVAFLRRLTGDYWGSLRCLPGLSEDPTAIHTGNSAYGALGLAYLAGAKRIALLGVDGTQDQYFYAGAGEAPRGSLAHLPALFASALVQLRDRGVHVVNGSPNSAVTCFPRMTPAQAVKWVNA